MALLKRASAPLYSGGVIVTDCTLIHTVQRTSPARASVLNQRPTKMGYTRPSRGKAIDHGHLGEAGAVSRSNTPCANTERQLIDEGKFTAMHVGVFRRAEGKKLKAEKDRKDSGARNK